ncbi:ABC transporter permease [Paeniroseomonas aquatica]|uniref:ABC transporter permease n=1 Tax=Paeniroseomonas aquatica TaxID=373043 RepID=UPI003618CCBB
MSTATTPTAAEAELAVQSRQAETKSLGYWAGVFKRVRRDPVTIVCGALLLLMLLAIVFAPLIAPHDPYQGSMIRRLRGIGTLGYPLGTDELGRDIVTRLLYGGRLSWFMGIVPVIFAFVIGTTLGVTAGFMGGKVNMAIMRTTDIFYAFPSVLLAVAISGALGAGIFNAILALTLVFIPQIIRVAESVTQGCATSTSSMRRGPRAPRASPSCGCMCWATCWGRSSSMRRG